MTIVNVSNPKNISTTAGAHYMENKGENVTCKVCKTRFTRFSDGKTSQGWTRFVDANGLTLTGLLCVPCKLKKSKHYYHHHRKVKKTIKSKELLGPSLRTVGGSSDVRIHPEARMRECDRCGARTHNYFNCVACTTTLRRRNESGIAEAEYYERNGGTT